MHKKLRALIESVVREVLAEAGDPYDAKNLEASCKHCGQDVWLVWEKAAPMFKWTECGGPGEGSCDGRFGGGKGGDTHADASADVELAPETMRSPSRAGISTKVKRSV